jgi:hypothetical protein
MAKQSADITKNLEENLNVEMNKFAKKNNKLMKNAQNDYALSKKGQSLIPERGNELISDLQERIKILQEDNGLKQQRIDLLKNELKTKELDVNYKTDNLDKITFGKLEAQTKEMANAAQQTIQTLQAMLDEKNDELELKEKEIEDLKEDRLKKVKEMRKVELECDRLKREMITNEAGRINMEHLSSVKILQKLSSMNHKEMEKMIMSYENKIRVLTEEMAEAEKSNAELVNKLRDERFERKKVENNIQRDTTDDNLLKLKREIVSLNKLNKKKNGELVRLKKLIQELKTDLLERDEELVKEKKSVTDKLMVTKTQTGETEVKLSVLTKKFTTLNKKLKESNNKISALKLAEIKSREKLREVLDKNAKYETMNTKLRDENLKLKKRASGSRKDLPTPTEKKGRRGSMKRRPSSGTRPKTQKMADRDQRKIENLEKKVKELEKINSEMVANLKADFIDDEDGTLISTQASAFKDLDDIVKTIRLYLAVNKSVKLYPVMKKSDSKNLGVAKKDEMIKDLESVGVKFSALDKRNFGKWLPQDKLGNVEYDQFYNMIMRRAHQCCGTVGSGGDGGVSLKVDKKKPVPKKYGMISSREKKPGMEDKDFREMNFLQQERNVKLLKKRLEGKQAEIKKLQSMMAVWKERALKMENELKDKQNKRRQPSIPASASDIDHRAPTQTTALKMIKELEDQLAEAKRLMNYETEKRDTDISHMNEMMKSVLSENKLISSENDIMRAQLEKIFQHKLTPNQLNEEKEKQRELLLSSLTAKLEKSRSREETLAQKVQLLEKENIELKYIKEGIDTRIEGLNRRNRELQSSFKPFH